MPAFPKPAVSFTFNAEDEIQNLRNYRTSKPGRQIPKKKKGHLLLATWNISNLGMQKREQGHYRLLAEIISWFDLIALQEVNDNLEGLRSIREFLPRGWRSLFSDKSGNNERMVFLYDGSKISVGEKIGEISLPPEDYRNVKLPGIKTRFTGFDRSPYIASFAVNDFAFVLVNVHLYFGKSSRKTSIERRCLETYCLARWADLRRDSKYCYSDNIILMGDFNLPKVDEDDPVYKALSSKGLLLPEHSSKVYSNIADDKEYDQIAFFPGLKEKLTASGVFDFDGGIFPQLFERSTPSQFASYLRYYLSDHRPKWVQMAVSS